MTKKEIRKQCTIGLSEDINGEFYPIYDFEKLHRLFMDEVCKYIKSHIDPELVIYHENTWCNIDGFIAGMRKELEL